MAWHSFSCPEPVMSLLAVLVVSGLVLYFMTTEERLWLKRWSEDAVCRTRRVVSRTHFGTGDPLLAEWRARRRWPVVACTLAVVNVTVMTAMLLGADVLGTPDMLVAWGGNFGPRTTGAERWRVLTSIFVHRDVLHLAVNIAVLVQLGLVLERILGPFTFGTVYVASGVLGSVMSTVASPLGVFVGATGAVCGLYGLLLVAAFRGSVQSHAVRVPLAIVRTLAPSALLFGLYHLATGDSWLAARVGLCAGIVSGVVLTRNVSDDRDRLRRFAALGAATAGIVMMSALGLRAVTDVRPAIADIVAAEERTAGEYDAAVRQFTKGAVTTRTLTQMIDQAILPQLRQSTERFDALVNVPAEHLPLVADALRYLHLRHDSWRTRADALRKVNMRHLREADEKEQAALRAFTRLKAQTGSSSPAESPPPGVVR